MDIPAFAQFIILTSSLQNYSSLAEKHNTTKQNTKLLSEAQVPNWLLQKFSTILWSECLYNS